MTQPTKSIRSQLLQTRLLNLFGAMAVVGICAAFVVRPRLQQFESIEIIERNGGQVWQIDKSKSGNVSRCLSLLRPPSIEIQFANNLISEDAAVAMSRISSIARLRLDHVDPRSWYVLDRQSHIRSIEIAGADDTVWQHLVRQASLESLTISGDALTGASVQQLDGLQRLRILNLSDTCVGDGLMKHVASLRRLEFVYLARTAITDDGIWPLATLPNLKVLHLSETAVTPKCLARIATISKLIELEIDCPAFCYDNTEDLLALRDLKLRRLFISCIVLDENGRPELGQGMPRCDIRYSQAYARGVLPRHVESTGQQEWHDDGQFLAPVQSHPKQTVNSDAPPQAGDAPRP
ncbi:MAG: hypothetical protein U0795_09240 [Pirellulales bacterium]